MVNRISPSSRAMNSPTTRTASCPHTHTGIHKHPEGHEMGCLHVEEVEEEEAEEEGGGGRPHGTLSSVSGVVGPWLMGKLLRPSNSYRLPSFSLQRARTNTETRTRVQTSA